MNVIACTNNESLNKLMHNHGRSSIKRCYNKQSVLGKRGIKNVNKCTENTKAVGVGGVGGVRGGEGLKVVDTITIFIWIHFNNPVVCFA